MSNRLSDEWAEDQDLNLTFQIGADFVGVIGIRDLQIAVARRRHEIISAVRVSLPDQPSRYEVVLKYRR